MRRFAGFALTGIAFQALGLIAFAEVGRSSWGASGVVVLQWLVLVAVCIGTIGTFWVALGGASFGRIAGLVAFVTVGFVTFEQTVALTIYPGLAKDTALLSTDHFEWLGSFLGFVLLHNLVAAAVASCGRKLWAARQLRFLLR